MAWRRPLTFVSTTSNVDSPGAARVVNTLVTTGATVEEVGLEERVGVGSEEFDNLLVLRVNRTPAVEDAVEGTKSTSPADAVLFEGKQYSLRSVTREYPNIIRVRAEREA